MTRIFVPSDGPNDWRRLLADPGRHWVPTSSAGSRGKVRGEIPAASPIRSRALWTLTHERQMQRSCSRYPSFKSICQEGSPDPERRLGSLAAPAPRWSHSQSSSPASLLIGWLASGSRTRRQPAGSLHASNSYVSALGAAEWICQGFAINCCIELRPRWCRPRGSALASASC